MKTSQVIVVTGASGFIAKHVMARLLNAGFTVRGTVRSLKKAGQITQTMSRMCGSECLERFSLVAADLLADQGWKEAMQGGAALVHVATYVPAKEPKDPEQVLAPAIEGTRRVLGFAVKAGIKRVVMTSSIAAIGYGHKKQSGEVRFGEDDWTNAEAIKGVWTYPQAKVLSEKLAWEMAKTDGLELTTICPSMVFGPAPDADTSASLKVVQRILEGKVPAMPPGGIGVVDVRDVAEIHTTALLEPQTIGKRIIANCGYVEFLRVAQILGSNYPDIKVPDRTAPAWLLRLLGRFDRTVRQISLDLDVKRIYDGSSGEKLLGRNYRDAEEATLWAAKSLYETGVVKRRADK